MIDTKQRILDTAEELFGEYGYSATSLRHIISKAKVNLAAIHYHFGSKQELLDQVILRKSEPVNELRLRLLDQYEAEAAPEPVCVEKIVEAFIMPLVLMDRNPEFVRLMGRMYAEGLMHDIGHRHFRPMVDRFLSAMHGALPEMPLEELIWKGHFMLGAMAHTLSVPPETDADLSLKPSIVVVRRLIAFVSSGFRAPATTMKEIEVNR